MTTQNPGVILTSRRSHLEPSLIKQLELDIKYRISNYDKASDSTLIAQINTFKESLKAGVAWSKNSDPAKLEELHKVIRELDFTSSELDHESLGEVYSNELISRSHKAYDERERLISQILEKHELSDSFFLTIEVAAQIRHEPNYGRKALKQIESAALGDEVSFEVLSAIRRQA